MDVRIPRLDEAHFTATGNSFATPHIAGLVTRILGKHPQLTVLQLKTILYALAAHASAEPRP